MNERASAKKRIARIGQFLVTGLLLFLLFRKVDFRAVIPILGQVNYGYFLISIAVVMLFDGFYALRWKYLLVHHHLRYSLLKLVKYNLIARFFQTILPSAVGGDVVRALLSFRKGRRIRITASILFARLLGLAVLTGFVVIDLIVLHRSLKLGEHVAPYVLPVGAFLLSAGTLVLVFRRLWIRPLAALGKNPRMKRALADFTVYFKDRRFFALILLLTCAIQLLSVASYYFSFKILHLEISFVQCLLYVPIITLACFLPISFNGQGLREGLIYFFYRDYIVREELFVLFIVQFLLTMVRVIPGGFLFLFFRRKDERLSLLDKEGADSDRTSGDEVAHDDSAS